MSVRMITVAALIGLSGCATFRPAKGHDRVETLVTERTGVSTGWGEGAPGGEAIEERVDALLEGGLDPDRAVAIALLHGPALHETYASLGISQAELMQAGLLSNPSLSLDLGVPIAHGLFELSGSLVQPLLELLMLPLKREAAEAGFAADVLTVAHEVVRTATEVKQEVYRLQAAEAKLALAQEILSLREATADLARRQRAAGNINALQRSQREVAYEALRLEVAQQELEVIAHRERLNRLLGLHGPRTGWTLTGGLPPLPEVGDGLDDLEARAVRARLDLAAARKAVAQLDTAVRLAKTFRLVGRVDLGVHTHQDPNGPLLIGPDLSLELPIFDQRQATIARLESQRAQAEARLRRLAVEARSEVREARAGLLTSEASVRHIEAQVLPLHARIVETSLHQYNAMQFGLYELVDAKVEQLHAQQDAIDARADFWSRAAELERLIGGRLSHPDRTAPPSSPEPAHSGAHPHHEAPRAPASSPEASHAH